MKKLLLSAALACFAFAVQTSAQVVISENFDAAVGGALPAGWTQGSTGTPGFKTSSFTAPITTNWGSATGTTCPTHLTQICLVDDWNDSVTSNLHDTLKSPVFSLSGMTNAWLNFDNYFYKAVKSATSAAEEAYVIGSMDGGTTWVNLYTIPGTAWDEEWVPAHVNLTALGTGTNIKIGFTYTDDADHIIGVALDDFEVMNLNTSSASVAAINYYSVQTGISTNGAPLSFTAQNSGLTITSLTAKYTINGGAPVVQTFTGLSILPYATSSLTFTSAIAGAVAGTNTINVVITDVNTIPNLDADSARTSTFALASATTQRQGLIEEFSSSTCPPCASFNAMYDPLGITLGMNTVGSNINVIKYQMNWPGSGNDRSYNADGLARRSYYGVSSIPEHFVNGAPSTATDYTAEANGSKVDPSFLDMSITYNVDTVTKKLGVLLNVTPRFTKTGAYHVYIAVVDKFYQNTFNTTGQLKYYHVMRKMLPNGTGTAVTSWTDGVTQSFVDTGVAYTNGKWELGTSNYPAQNTYKLWNNPLTGSEVIAFVEEDATKTVMQSIFTLPAGFVSVSTMAKVEGIKLYPNPTKDEATLQFDLQEAGNVHITVMDYSGKLISEVANKDMSLGMQNVSIKTNNIAPGNYIVLISTETGNRAERLTVIR